MGFSTVNILEEINALDRPYLKKKNGNEQKWTLLQLHQSSINTRRRCYSYTQYHNRCRRPERPQSRDRVQRNSSNGVRKINQETPKQCKNSWHIQAANNSSVIYSDVIRLSMATAQLCSLLTFLPTSRTMKTKLPSAQRPWESSKTEIYRN